MMPWVGHLSLIATLPQDEAGGPHSKPNRTKMLPNPIPNSTSGCVHQLRHNTQSKPQLSPSPQVEWVGFQMHNRQAVEHGQRPYPGMDGHNVHMQRALVLGPEEYIVTVGGTQYDSVLESIFFVSNLGSRTEYAPRSVGPKFAFHAGPGQEVIGLLGGGGPVLNIIQRPALEPEPLGEYQDATFCKGDVVYLKGGPYTGREEGWPCDVIEDLGDLLVVVSHDDHRRYREAKTLVCKLVASTKGISQAMPSLGSVRRSSSRMQPQTLLQCIMTGNNAAYDEELFIDAVQGLVGCTMGLKEAHTGLLSPRSKMEVTLLLPRDCAGQAEKALQGAQVAGFTIDMVLSLEQQEAGEAGETGREHETKPSSPSSSQGADAPGGHAGAAAPILLALSAEERCVCVYDMGSGAPLAVYMCTMASQLVSLATDPLGSGQCVAHDAHGHVFALQLMNLGKLHPESLEATPELQ